uniref:SCP2 sterol-binding domain-containing protein n=1 Tax=Acetatifactor sp. TaxID=1872090 RepID=UPI0040572343
MRYEELVELVRNAMKQTRVSKIVGHVAFQFNVEGEAEGAFYVELSDGKINVEPYEYYDRDVLIVTSAAVIIQMLEGKIQSREAYANGQIRAYGDIENLNVLPFGWKEKRK